MRKSQQYSGMSRIRILVAVVLVFAAGFGSSLAFGNASDPGIANALTRVGSSFGWAVSLFPPGPCLPPDPCKVTLNLDIQHRLRADLNQQISFVHQKDGQIDPCWKVFNVTDAETGRLSFRFDILDADPADLANATITVPPGFELMRNDSGGYSLVALRGKRMTKSPRNPAGE